MRIALGIIILLVKFQASVHADGTNEFTFPSISTNSDKPLILQDCSFFKGTSECMHRQSLIDLNANRLIMSTQYIGDVAPRIFLFLNGSIYQKSSNSDEWMKIESSSNSAYSEIEDVLQSTSTDNLLRNQRMFLEESLKVALKDDQASLAASILEVQKNLDKPFKGSIQTIPLNGFEVTLRTDINGLTSSMLYKKDNVLFKSVTNTIVKDGIGDLHFPPEPLNDIAAPLIVTAAQAGVSGKLARGFSYVLENGLYRIRFVIRDSPAMRAGVSAGMVLKSIGGIDASKLTPEMLGAMLRQDSVQDFVFLDNQNHEVNLILKPEILR